MLPSNPPVPFNKFGNRHGVFSSKSAFLQRNGDRSKMRNISYKHKAVRCDYLCSKSRTCRIRKTFVAIENCSS